jgi:hypothetical protein
LQISGVSRFVSRRQLAHAGSSRFVSRRQLVDAGSSRSSHYITRLRVKRRGETKRDALEAAHEPDETKRDALEAAIPSR